MRVQIAIAFIVGVLVLLVTTSALPQTTPAQSAPAQTPSTALIQNQPPALAPASATTNVNAVSGPAAANPVTTPVTGVGNETSSSLGKSFGSAGNGLPGMPGGSPVNTVPGARDPSAQYMRPPVIPPVLCDPAIDLPC